MQLNHTPGINRESPAQAHLLREEISFWQEMLFALEGPDHPRESVERVQQALALAQYRLSLMVRHSSH